jgi:polar amino acid transport system ATP-binding protein
MNEAHDQIVGNNVISGNNRAAPLIRVDRATKRFGARLVLDDVSLTIGTGETVAIIGPSGGGKSTLLRCMNGLTVLDAGAVHVGGLSLGPQAAASTTRNHNGQANARDVRRIVGMIFQDFQLFPHLTVLENVIEAPRCVLRQSHDAAVANARRLLERVGLGDRGNSYPQQLSGGQKQRVAIARALAMQPQGLLCDEITSALDPELKHEVLNVVTDLKRDSMTIVMVTHEIGFARRAADRIIVLADGRIVEDGPPDQVLDAPQSSRTKQFLANVMA